MDGAPGPHTISTAVTGGRPARSSRNLIFRAFQRASLIALRNAGDDSDHSDAVNLVSTANTPASEINTWSTSKFLPNGTLSTRVHRLLRPFRVSALQLSPTDPMNAARAPLISITSQAMLQPSVAMNA